MQRLNFIIIEILHGGAFKAVSERMLITFNEIRLQNYYLGTLLDNLTQQEIREITHKVSIIQACF